MGPAKNINDFVNNLLLGFLTENERNFYVPLYYDKLQEIKDRVIYDRLEHQTIYIMGQVGTGKTTALNFLPDPDIREEFEVISFFATDLFDMNDVDIADVLLTVAYQLMKGNKSLEQKFEKELEKIKKKIEGYEFDRIQETGVKVEGGVNAPAGMGHSPIGRFLGLLKAGFDIFANIRLDSQSREIVREVFNVSPKDVFEATNKVIESYKEEILKHKKQLLLVFNELDHVRNAKIISKLFVDNRSYLDGLRCKKIISVPVVLMTYGQFMETREVTNDFIGLKLIPNPIVDGIDRSTSQTIEENRELLKEVVYKRIDPEVKLIDDEALDYAIDHSGGIIRQFIKILSHAGRRVRRLKGERISINDVDYGADKVRQELEASLIGTEKIALLEEVRTTHKPSTNDRDLLIECLLANQILAFRNEPTWYSINPLIEKTVKIYAIKNKNE